MHRIAAFSVVVLAACAPSGGDSDDTASLDTAVVPVIREWLTRASSDTPPLVSVVFLDAATPDAPSTRSGLLTVRFAAEDAEGLSEFCIDEAGTCTSWVALSSATLLSGDTTSGWWSVPYILSAGDGARTVHVRVRDLAGAIAGRSDSILLDTTPPAFGNSVFTALGASGRVDLAWMWAQIADATSGIGMAVVREASGGAAAPACPSTGALATVTGQSSYAHIPLVNEVSHEYRLCVVDLAGNWAEAIAWATPSDRSNTAPTLTAAAFSTDEDVPRTLDLQGFDDDSDTLRFALVTPPGAGSVSRVDFDTFSYAPPAHWSGSTTFVVHATDGLAYSNLASITMTVVAANDPPVGADAALTVLEETSLSFVLANFSFSDPLDAAPNALAGVVFVAPPVPSIGNLSLLLGESSVPLFAGQEIAVADLSALRYLPAVDAYGNAQATLSFRLRDDGGTAHSGQDMGSNYHSLTVHVTPVNDPPVATANSHVTLYEDTVYRFKPADFYFSDPNDAGSDQDSLYAVTFYRPAPQSTFTQLASHLNGATLTGGANYFGTNVYVMPIRLIDDGGTANGGQNTSVNTVQLRATITAVSDAPTSNDASIRADEDVFRAITATDVPYADAADASFGGGNPLAALLITALPAKGVLRHHGVVIGVESLPYVVPVADLIGGNLGFQAAHHEHGAAGYASFAFKVRDRGADGSADEGRSKNTSVNAYTMTIAVDPVNDAPSGSSFTRSLFEDGSRVLYREDFGFSDTADALDEHTMTHVEVILLPGRGGLALDGAPLSPVPLWIPIADIDAGKLVYTPIAGEAGLASDGGPYSSFQFRVRDSGGTERSGVDTQVSASTMAFDVAPLDDAPVGGDVTLTAIEDTPYVFSTSHFPFSDPLDGPPASDRDHRHAFAAVRLTTLPAPADGALLRNGSPVSMAARVPVAELATGKLVFIPAANRRGTAVARFTFQVEDTGTAPGQNLESAANAHTVTFDVTPVNDAPIGSDGAVSLLEDTTYTFAASDFSFSDAADGTDPADATASAFAAVRIVAAPAHGVLEIWDSVSASGTRVTAGADVPVGFLSRLRYRPLNNGNGLGYGTFTFTVRDDGGTPTDPADDAIDPIVRTMAVDVVPVNDLPTAVPVALQILEENGSAAISLSWYDADLTALDFIVTTSANHGTLTLGPATATSQVVYYSPNSGYYGLDAFTFTVGDGEAITAPLTVNLLVNRGPVLSDGAVRIDLDGTPHPERTASRAVTVEFQAFDTSSHGQDALIQQFCLSSSPICTNWQNIGSTSAPYTWRKPFMLSEGDGPKTVYVQVRDARGATSVIVSDSASLDTIGPVTTLDSLRAGESVSAWNTRTVALRLTATDDSSVVDYCLSDGTSCSGPWTAYPVGGVVARDWILPLDVEGSYVVRAWTRDVLGNLGTAEKTLYLDRTPPVDPALNVNVRSDGDFLVWWNAGTDVTSGIVSYRLVYAEGTVPVDCAAGSPVFNPSFGSTPGVWPAPWGTTYPISVRVGGLTTGTPYAFRLCSVDAASNLSLGSTASAVLLRETEPPAASTFVLAGGAVGTRTNAVSVHFVAADKTGIHQFCLSNSGSCTTWITLPSAPLSLDYAASWRLSVAPLGLKTVRLWLRDVYGNTSSIPYSDTIYYDNLAPVDGRLTVTGTGTASAQLTWADFRDLSSGIAAYTVRVGTSALSSCAAGTLLYSGSATAFVHSGLTIGTTYFYRVCATDLVGNSSAGVQASFRAVAESVPPTGSVVINGGAAFTGNRAATLSLVASDASGVASMCVTTATRCTAFVPFSSSVPVSLAGSSGSKLYRVWLRDTLGNTSLTPLSDAIVLDVLAPTRGAVTAAPAAGKLTVAWSGFADNSGGSGIASYQLAYAKGATPAPACTSGIRVSPATSGHLLIGLSPGNYTVRVCPVDAVGNVGVGVTRSANVP